MSGIWKNATLWRNDHELGVLLMIWSRFKLDVLHYWCFLMHRPSLKYKNKHKSYLSELHGKVASHLLHVWGAFLPLFCVLLQLCSKRCHLSSVHLKGLRFPYKWLLCSSLWHQLPDHRPTAAAYLLRSSACSQSVSQGGFCVLTLFILFLVKMWYSGFLSLGLGGYCGGAIGECGWPLGRPTKSCLHPACHSLHLGPAVTPCGRAAVSCSCRLVKRHTEGLGMKQKLLFLTAPLEGSQPQNYRIGKSVFF